MKEQQTEKMYRSMTNIREDFLEDPELSPSVSPWKRIRRFWRVAAVCACLMLCIGTVLAAAGLGTQLLDLFSGRAADSQGSVQSGYDLLIHCDLFPMTVFSPEARTGMEQQLEQDLPQFFATDTGARHYLGFDAVQSNMLPLDIQWSILQVYPGKDGRIHQITIQTIYDTDSTISAQTATTILTEHFDAEEFVLGWRTEGERTFYEGFYETASELTCHVFSYQDESGSQSIQGWLVIDGILYTLALTCPQGQQGQCETLLHNWADSFHSPELNQG